MAEYGKKEIKLSGVVELPWQLLRPDPSLAAAVAECATAPVFHFPSRCCCFCFALRKPESDSSVIIYSPVYRAHLIRGESRSTLGAARICERS